MSKNKVQVYGIRDLCHTDLGIEWLVAWWHQGITWTNFDWQTSSEILWHSFEGNVYLNTQESQSYVWILYTFRITAISPRGQWVNKDFIPIHYWCQWKKLPSLILFFFSEVIWMENLVQCGWLCMWHIFFLDLTAHMWISCGVTLFLAYVSPYNKDRTFHFMWCHFRCGPSYEETFLCRTELCIGAINHSVKIARK